MHKNLPCCYSLMGVCTKAHFWFQLAQIPLNCESRGKFKFDPPTTTLKMLFGKTEPIQSTSTSCITSHYPSSDHDLSHCNLCSCTSGTFPGISHPQVEPRQRVQSSLLSTSHIPTSTYRARLDLSACPSPNVPERNTFRCVVQQ